MTKKQQQGAVFVFGVSFIVIMLLISLEVPNPTVSQYETFKVILALSAAGVAAFIPGFFELKISALLRAGGAIAVFVLIYVRTPAQIVSQPPNPTHQTQELKEPSNIDTSVVIKGNTGNIRTGNIHIGGNAAEKKKDKP